MPDHAIMDLPRIAFVFGDDDTARHVREAMHGQAEIVYSAAHGDFDAARLRDAGVVAVLANVDGGDWLAALEDSVCAAGVPLVLNDPDISRRLEGWERARWLRHLAAKLRGSRDYDPPRPSVAPAGAPEVSAAPHPVVDRPLSPQEIETLTVDFTSPAAGNAAAAVAEVPAPGAGDDADVDDAAAAGVEAEAGAVAAADPPPAAEPLVDTTVRPEDAATVAAGEDAAEDPAGTLAAGSPEDAGSAGDATELDIDTEALSAMIDARLAEDSPAAADDDGIWRVAGDDASADVAVPDAEQAAAPAMAAPPAEMAGDNRPVDDVDVLAGLPSLADWQLVDPDAAPAAAARKTAPTDVDVLAGSFAGLELVPMEATASVQAPSEPIERWLHGEGGAKKAARSDAGGERQP